MPPSASSWTSIRTVSSTKSGLPSARRSTDSATSNGRSCSAISASASWRLSAEPSGSTSIVVERDPRRGLDHLGDRPVGDALAVREAAAGQDGDAVGDRRELADEPALAHAGLAVDGEELGAAVADGAVEGVLEQI